VSEHGDIIRLIASRSITRERACDGRRAYRTPEHAAKKAEEFNDFFAGAYKAYHCPFCEQYHLATAQEAA